MAKRVSLQLTVNGIETRPPLQQWARSSVGERPL